MCTLEMWCTLGLVIKSQVNVVGECVSVVNEVTYKDLTGLN